MVLVLVVYDRCRPLWGGGGGGGPGLFYRPPPPPCPPRGADMLDMTTDAQEGNNKTLQGLINTMQSHSVVMRFEITVIFY